MIFDPLCHPKITVTDEGCWLYDGGPTGKGYTKLAAGASYVVAHAAFYAVLIGPVQRGQQLHHRCKVRECVNPDHLEPVWPQQHRSEHYVKPDTCPQGHPYPEHEFHDKEGRLRCRTCTRDRQRAYKDRKKLERAEAAAGRTSPCLECGMKMAWPHGRRRRLRCPECGGAPWDQTEAA